MVSIFKGEGTTCLAAGSLKGGFNGNGKGSEDRTSSIFCGNGFLMD